MTTISRNKSVALRTFVVLSVLLCGAAAVGCDSTPPGTRRVLGDVTYDRAFTAGRDVMRQYFTLAESSHRDRVIRSTPRLIESSRHGLSSPLPARQVATMKLRREGRSIVAYMAVAVQEQSSEVYRQLARHDEGQMGGRYGATANLDSATTVSQNELWQTVRYDHKLQRTVLEQLVRELAPAGDMPESKDAVEKTQ